MQLYTYSYTLAVDVDTEGDVSVSVPDGVVVDTNGVSNPASTTFTVEYDVSPPTLVVTVGVCCFCCNCRLPRRIISCYVRMC
jgi:hypothetical protein